MTFKAHRYQNVACKQQSKKLKTKVNKTMSIPFSLEVSFM